MKNSILVNNISIEKETIKDFLIQNRKLEAVKYVMEKSGIGMASAKEIVEMFQDNTINNFDDKDIFKEITKNTSSFHTSAEISKPKKNVLKKIAVFLIVSFLSGFLFLKYVVGFQHIGMHVRALQSMVFDNEDTSAPIPIVTQADEVQTAVSTTDVADAVLESPMDTLIWFYAIKNKEYGYQESIKELEKYRKKDFSKLVIADDSPSNKEAEQAIVHRYKNEVVSLLQEYKAHIQIGTCYKAPLGRHSDGDLEIARVTAMVSAFNKERGNLGNIQQPLDVIYDFVKYKSDPATWYITDFSQNIPYDYKLNKDGW